MLELEEEQEIENMIEFKKNYVKKKCQKSDQDWNDVVAVEMDKIEEKEKILSDLFYNSIKQNNLSNKVKSHSAACKYLRDLLPSSI